MGALESLLGRLPGQAAYPGRLSAFCKCKYLHCLERLLTSVNRHLVKHADDAKAFKVSSKGPPPPLQNSPELTWGCFCKFEGTG